MDVHVPEFDLRWRMAVRLTRALPLLLVLMVAVGLALSTVHAPLLALLLGTAASGLLAALAVARSVAWTPRAAVRHDPVPTAESLTSA